MRNENVYTGFPILGFPGPCHQSSSKRQKHVSIPDQKRQYHVFLLTQVRICCKYPLAEA